MTSDKIQFFAEDTQRLYQLYPTQTAPVLRISGVPMHRYTVIDPLKDALIKIDALNPSGLVLDTCTGLGYTAINLAKRNEVTKVITIEKDHNVIDIAKLNQPSEELFNNKKIELILGDASIVIKSYKDSFFDYILHDPPTFKMAPMLYNINFYKEAFRVLKKGGRIYHYLPSPGKLEKIASVKQLYNRVIRDLSLAGFKDVRYVSLSSGFLATKRV